MADSVKDQYTDELTLNVEREVAKNLSISATYISSTRATCSPMCPINRVTGQEWEYERIPFETSSGQQVMLYSVVEKDYNGDGVIDSDDIAWIGDNTTSRVQNLADLRRHQAAAATTRGCSSCCNKRYSDRWQALASFLYSNSTGIGRRSLRQDVNVEGPMFWDDNWMSSLNQTINNLEGPLPFTPKYEFKLSGSYMIPEGGASILVAGCGRTAGRPLWQLETYPQHTQFGDPPGGVIDPGGTARSSPSTELRLSADADPARPQRR